MSGALHKPWIVKAICKELQQPRNPRVQLLEVLSEASNGFWARLSDRFRWIDAWISEGVEAEHISRTQQRVRSAKGAVFTLNEYDIQLNTEKTQYWLVIRKITFVGSMFSNRFEHDGAAPGSANEAKQVKALLEVVRRADRQAEQDSGFNDTENDTHLLLDVGDSTQHTTDTADEIREDEFLISESQVRVISALANTLPAAAHFLANIAEDEDRQPEPSKSPRIEPSCTPQTVPNTPLEDFYPQQVPLGIPEQVEEDDESLNWDTRGGFLREETQNEDEEALSNTGVNTNKEEKGEEEDANDEGTSGRASADCGSMLVHPPQNELLSASPMVDEDESLVFVDTPELAVPVKNPPEQGEGKEKAGTVNIQNESQDVPYDSQYAAKLRTFFWPPSGLIQNVKWFVRQVYREFETQMPDVEEGADNASQPELITQAGLQTQDLPSKVPEITAEDLLDASPSLRFDKSSDHSLAGSALFLGPSSPSASHSSSSSSHSSSPSPAVSVSSVPASGVVAVNLQPDDSEFSRGAFVPLIRTPNSMYPRTVGLAPYSPLSTPSAIATPVADDRISIHVPASPSPRSPPSSSSSSDVPLSFSSSASDSAPDPLLMFSQPSSPTPEDSAHDPPPRQVTPPEKIPDSSPRRASVRRNLFTEDSQRADDAVYDGDERVADEEKKDNAEKKRKERAEAVQQEDKSGKKRRCSIGRMSSKIARQPEAKPERDEVVAKYAYWLQQIHNIRRGDEASREE